MIDPDSFMFFSEEASPTAIEVPVLKVFDGDGLTTPQRSTQFDLALSMLQSLSNEVVVKRETFSLL